MVGITSKTNSYRDGMSSNLVVDLSRGHFNTLYYWSMGNGTSRGKANSDWASIWKSRKELRVSFSFTLTNTMMKTKTISSKRGSMVANSNRNGSSSNFMIDLSRGHLNILNYRDMGNSTSRGKCKRSRSSIRSSKAKKLRVSISITLANSVVKSIGTKSKTISSTNTIAISQRCSSYNWTNWGVVDEGSGRG